MSVVVVRGGRCRGWTLSVVVAVRGDCRPVWSSSVVVVVGGGHRPWLLLSVVVVRGRLASYKKTGESSMSGHGGRTGECNEQNKGNTYRSWLLSVVVVVAHGRRPWSSPVVGKCGPNPNEATLEKYS